MIKPSSTCKGLLTGALLSLAAQAQQSFYMEDRPGLDQVMLTLLASAPPTSQFVDRGSSVDCKYFSNSGTWYDYSTLDQSAGFQVASGSALQNTRAGWNFCAPMPSTTDASWDELGCQPGANAYYAEINEGRSGGCTPASTTEYSSISFSEINDSMVSLVYSNPDTGCSLEVDMICTESETPVIGQLTLDSAKGACAYKTSYAAQNACSSFSVNAIWDFFGGLSWLWGAMMIVGGAFLAFMGRKLFVAAIFIATVLASVTLVMLIFYGTFLKSNTEPWVGWTVLVASVLLGCIAGYFMMKIQRVGAAILAGWGGFLLGALLNETVLYFAGSSALFWVVTIGCAVVAAVLTFFVYNHVLIIMTSFMGSYLFFRGISLYAGGFPNEFEVTKERKEDIIDGLGWSFYAYLAAIIISCVLTAWFQFKQLARMTEADKHPYARLS